MNLDFLRTQDKGSRVLMMAIAFALIVGLSSQFTGNVFKTNSFYIDRGHFVSGDSSCDRLGGYVLNTDTPKEIKGKIVRLHSVSNDVSLISVDRAKRAMEPGHEKYVAGLFVTVHSTGSRDACLLVK